jgi:hypothetical protein
MDLQVKGGRTMLQLSQQKGYAGIATLKLNTKREREEEENFEEEQLFPIPWRQKGFLVNYTSSLEKSVLV